MKSTFGVGECRSSKTAILTHLETLNFDYYEFLHFAKAEIDKENKIQSPKDQKLAFLELLECQKLISRKI